MSDDLVTWLRAQLDDDERVGADDVGGMCDGGVHLDRDRWLREVEAKRRILDEHAPEWRTVEWDHDQNGKGEAPCCPRCQNAEHSEWNPPRGQARGLPDGFVAPYVLAPCRTLRLLALAYAGESGYRTEWRP